MANHLSALKRARQTRKRTAINRRNKGVLRVALRQIRQNLAGGDLATARRQMPEAISCVDKAIQKGTLHRNTAARLKSRLLARLHALAASQTA